MITRQDVHDWKTPKGHPMLIVNISTIDAERYLGMRDKFFTIEWARGKVRMHRYFDEEILPVGQEFLLPDTLEELEALIRMACAMMGEER